MNKRKLSLVMSIIIGLTATTTAAVSTYAWFQAEAQVQIQAVGDSTTITVAKPDDYAFYAYKGNKNLSHSLDGSTWNSDWDTITSSNASNYTSFSSMSPGQTYYFALEMSTTIGDTVSLSIKELVSNTIVDQKGSNSFHRYVTKTSNWDTDVNIGWAINIYAYATTAKSGYSSFITNPSTTNVGGDKFTYATSNTAVTTNSSYVSHGSTDYLYGSTDSLTKVITLNENNALSIYSASASATTTVLYYAVQFDNSVLYKEVTTGSSEIYIIDDSQVGANIRYFSSDQNGNSNCFAGLSFQLVNLKLDF